MPIIKSINGRYQNLIPLQIHPHKHSSTPTITGSAVGSHAGTVLYGSYNMDYLLPGGDYLRLIANHNKSAVQLLLISHDPEKLRNLPGVRQASIVANSISMLNRYRIRSDSYAKPRTEAQLAKYKLATHYIEKLQILLELERELAATDWSGQENLRHKIIKLIERCRDENRLIANNPVVSEGQLGSILYDIHQFAHHYEFNRVHPVSRIDQLDFSQHVSEQDDIPPSYVWDSQLHISNDEAAIADTLRVICQEYGLNPGKKLGNIASNRFKRVQLFFNKLWQDGRDLVNYLANPHKADHATEIINQTGGISVTKIKPYYHLQGFIQNGYPQLDLLVANLAKVKIPPYEANNIEEAKHLLSTKANGSWVILPGNQLILRLQDKMIPIHYFEENDLYYPLPTGDDLFSLSELAKGPLFLPERLGIKFKAFLSRIPAFFVYLFNALRDFIRHDLYDDFSYHVNAGHLQPAEPISEEDNEDPLAQRSSTELYKMSLQEILKNHGLLANGQTLEGFIKTQISNSNYVIIREKHPPSPQAYDNPLHRALSVARHISGFFVNASEKHPIIGTLALAAYLYGAGSIIAPHILIGILTKLHLKGLIAAIKPTQALGQWMSHGTFSEALSAATTYWQAMIIAGNFDQFFIQAVDILKDDPAEVAIVLSLAIFLGWGLCQAVPSFQKEMGEFPYINYAFLGAKQGIAINDTLKNPGNDWLIGTIKWLLRGALIFSKMIFSPFIEWYRYGFKSGLIFGLKKSGLLLIRTVKQIIAALADLVLAITTIPFYELTSLVIHVPFRGLTNMLSKTLATIGNWHFLGEALLNFATRPDSWNYLTGFRFSPLYGFSSLYGRYSENRIINILLNLAMTIISPPLQLIKNLVVLPITDALSLSTRLLLTVLNPVTRFIAYTPGILLTTSAIIWDNSIGIVFRSLAEGVTLSANWIDKLAGNFKYACLGKIQIFRRQVYHWAFNDEDLLIHGAYADRKPSVSKPIPGHNDDFQYLFNNPINAEHLPHNETYCLFDALLGDKLPVLTKAPNAQPPSHDPLFHLGASIEEDLSDDDDDDDDDEILRASVYNR